MVKHVFNHFAGWRLKGLKALRFLKSLIFDWLRLDFFKILWYDMSLMLVTPTRNQSYAFSFACSELDRIYPF